MSILDTMDRREIAQYKLAVASCVKAIERKWGHGFHALGAELQDAIVDSETFRATVLTIVGDDTGAVNHAKKFRIILRMQLDLE